MLDTICLLAPLLSFRFQISDFPLYFKEGETHVQEYILQRYPLKTAGSMRDVTITRTHETRAAKPDVLQNILNATPSLALVPSKEKKHWNLEVKK